MAKKHFDAYYNEICNQFIESRNILKQFEQVAMEGIVPPERLEEMKKNIEPIKANYQMLSYIAFLLNKPNKETKVKRYEKQNQKLIKSVEHKYTLDAMIEENSEAIEEMNKNLGGKDEVN